MIVARDFDELLASPAGRYVTGPISVSFVVDPTLVGALVWGRPTAEQIDALVRGHERMRPVLAARIAALIDVRWLEWPDSAAFGSLVRFVVERRSWLAEYIDRLAVVRPENGAIATAAAGFFAVTPTPCSVDVFTDLGAALRWIGRDDAEGRAAELETVFGEATGNPEMLRKVRAQLEARPGALSLEELARAVGVTERSLQRRLKEWKTSFRAEQNQAQVRAAKRLLRDSEATLAAIASEVGCASLAHFSTLFRRVTGESPSDWRKRNRPQG